jgi:hypothetical protein
LGILQDLLKFLFSEAAKDLLGDANRCVDMGYERSKNAHFHWKMGDDSDKPCGER